jgi:hypothetical protein
VLQHGAADASVTGILRANAMATWAVLGTIEDVVETRANKHYRGCAIEVVCGPDGGGRRVLVRLVSRRQAAMSKTLGQNIGEVVL